METKLVEMVYCVKCRAQRKVRNPQAMILKNRIEATAGECPVCGTRLFSIGDQGGALLGMGSSSASLV